jgi:predicted amidohydrolase
MKTALLIFLLAAPIETQDDRNPGRLKMALVNLKCLTSDSADPEANKANLQANLKRHLYFIDRASKEGAEFVGFPELSINGYHFSATMTWLSLDGPEVKVLRQKAAEKGVYLSAGLAEQDREGKKWNTQIVIDPKGEILCAHHKSDLTKEKGFVEIGREHEVFAVKGAKMGIVICAEGSFQKNLQALVEGGARIIYGPHANTTGGTVAGWYKFRAPWAEANGWIAQLKVHAAIHNHAGVYNPEFDPPAGNASNTGWASGAWFIGPDGQTLAQMPTSTQKGDSKEFVLLYNIPIAGR